MTAETEKSDEVQITATWSTRNSGRTFVQEQVAVALRSTREEREDARRLYGFVLLETGEVAI